MTWNTPQTWLPVTEVVAADLNREVRDNFKAIGDSMAPYTPTWTAAGTDPVIGNGTIVGRYMEAGKMIRFRVIITVGTTTSFGVGQYLISLPVAAATGLQVADLVIYDGTTFFGKGRINGSTAGLYVPATTAGNADRLVTGTVPATLASTNSITVTGTYEAA